jgi:hypothetical protein
MRRWGWLDARSVAVCWEPSDAPPKSPQGGPVSGIMPAATAETPALAPQ